MKRFIFITLILLAFASPGLCVDSELQDLTADTTPGTDSLLYTVDDPGGTPASRKSTIAQVLIDGNIPNTITIDTATTAGSLTANPADCSVSTEFAVGINQSGVAACEAIADADVPNTITVDLATLATTATTANAGDSGTAFFSLGTIEDARLPTSMADKTVTGTTTVSGTLDINGNIVGTKHQITLNIDGGGSVITTGTLDTVISAPFDCILNEVVALLDTTGTITVDVMKDTYGNYPPTSADTIVASAPITVGGALKSTDSTLTGWNNLINAGDILRFRVDTVSNATHADVRMLCTKD